MSRPQIFLPLWSSWKSLQMSISLKWKKIWGLDKKEISFLNHWVIKPGSFAFRIIYGSDFISVFFSDSYFFAFLWGPNFPLIILRNRLHFPKTMKSHKYYLDSCEKANGNASCDVSWTNEHHVCATERRPSVEWHVWIYFYNEDWTVFLSLTYRLTDNHFGILTKSSFL